ncbi:MAG: putative baseplate assembly protein [Caldilinea sp.]
MLSPTPVLDDRSFQQIVDEMKKRIPLYCPEWTDHNVSDPGVTLIELFAWMTELILYRLNQVPDLHYIRFMEFLGLEHKAPSAAQTGVTFWLTKPLTYADDPDNAGLLIPGGVEVSTTQTESIAPVIFATDEGFKIKAPRLAVMLLERAAPAGKSVWSVLRGEELQRVQSVTGALSMFSEIPEKDDAVYFGFEHDDRDLSFHILSLRLRFNTTTGIGINIDYPPYVWEVHAPTGFEDWVAADVEHDSTRGMTMPGEVVLHLPRLVRQPLPNAPDVGAYAWVRVRIRQPSARDPIEFQRRMHPYRESPRLEQIEQVASLGATINASHVRHAPKEYLGESDGVPGQRFRLSGAPGLLPLRPAERLRVKVNAADEDTAQELWQYVETFADSGPDDQHFTIDSRTGEVRFGPAVRTPRGEIVCYGRTPPRGAHLYFEHYRYGGGAQGNMSRKRLNVLKTSIPYVDRIENRKPAMGGADVQSLEAVRMTAQRLVRTRGQAITAEDYETRVLERFGASIARAKCIVETVDDKQVARVVVAPHLNGNSRQVLTTDLNVDPSLLSTIEQYLDSIRLLTVRVEVKNVKYRRIRVEVEVQPKANVDPVQLEHEIIHFLDLYLHPTLGGSRGDGWPFGRAVTSDEINRRIAAFPGVMAVKQVWLRESGESDAPQADGVTEIPLGLDETVVLVMHAVRCLPA